MEAGLLHVRNEIYRRVFDHAWIRASTPINWAMIGSVAAVAAAVLALITAIVVVQQQQERQLRDKITFASEQFRGSGDADVKLTYLASICDLKQDQAAQMLFFGQTQEQQEDLFEHVMAQQAGDNLVSVVGCLAPAIAANAHRSEHDQALVRAMSCALHASKRADAEPLRRQLGYTGDCPSDYRLQ